MENFYTRVLSWATKRNITKGSTASKQRTKTWEELTEVAEGLSKSKLDLAKDAIGDCAVTTTNMMGCMGIDPVHVGERAHKLANPLDDKPSNYDLYDLDGLVNLFVQHVAVARPKEQPILPLDVVVDGCDEERQAVMNEYHFVVALGALEHCARRLGLTFEECQEQAWHEIKDRKGMLIAGTFVKEQDIQATADLLIRKATDTILADLPRGGTEETYLAAFTAKLREHFNALLPADTIGVYATVGNTVGGTTKQERFPTWGNVEAMSLITRLYLDLGDGVHIVASDHRNVAIVANNAVDLLPEMGDYCQSEEINPRALDTVRKYHTLPGLADSLNRMGYFPDRVVNAADKKEKFDNGVEFVQLFINTTGQKSVQYTAAVLV